MRRPYRGHDASRVRWGRHVARRRGLYPLPVSEEGLIGRSTSERTGRVATTRTVGILIFDDVEVLDFCGPFEVFSTARPAGLDGPDDRLFRVLIIADEARTISARGGLLVQPHHTIDDHPPLDVLLVPGGVGT